MANEEATRGTQDQRVFDIGEAISYLKAQGKISADYSVRQYRDSTILWGFAGHVLAKTFRLVGTDRFALKTCAA